ncbi:MULTISPECIES: penicillin-binding protein 2 [Microbacterium]|uniref:peptidoglycan D,D-transpeptidase FtsI family protein n=1 Tax=Microbacterium TaxID=33882 RepID=UPI001E43CFFE|nr:penicillin-binding protein 2 [Microbacterium nymphoidis]MCD2499202.1 penicillin-binding protein 2 [Microbacterium nymphoidis]
MTPKDTRIRRRRTVAVFGTVGVLMVAFSVRLVDIQVVNASEYVAESKLKTQQSKPIAGTRGEIVDANGAVLAVSNVTYDAVIDPLNLNTVFRLAKDGTKIPLKEEWPAVSEKIAAIIGRTGDEVRTTVANNFADNPNSRYALLTTGLSTAQMEQLKALAIPYLAMPSHESRTYPDGAVAGSVIGFTGTDPEKGTVFPQAGVESMENACLTPTAGSQTFQMGGNGEIIPGSMTETPAVNGGTVQLTIDRDLNWYLQQMIAEEAQNKGAKSGTVTVVEVATGKIRAAAEWPTVDPNNIDGSDPNDWYGHIFKDLFEPGSTFKAATAAMLLESGAATPMSTVSASGWEEFPNGARVGDSFSHDTYNYTLAGALIDSSNVALSKFGDLMTPEARHDFLAKFGVGSKTAVNFDGEQAGVLHPADQWDNQTHYATTFGQAFQVTAPQVASFYQMIANDGVKKPLQLVESCTAADGTVTTPKVPADERLLSEQNAAQLSTMIENVAEQGGVADLIKIPGYRIAAKTGTAQTYDEATQAYKSDLYDVSVVGYAPADDPKYVVIVTLKEPTTVRSSTAAAPAFQKAMTQVLKHYRVMPSQTPFTDLLPKFG